METMIGNTDTESYYKNPLTHPRRRKVHEATHGSDKTHLTLGNIEIPAYVLDNGQRVISRRGLQNSLGIPKDASGREILRVVALDKISHLITPAIQGKLENYYIFRRAGAGGSAPLTYGYDATLLVDLCDVLMQARKENLLTPQQEMMAERAEMILRSVARVGIIALVDEATGYQETRERKALQGLLEQYLQKEFSAWTKTFPDQFFKEIFRLKHWTWQPHGVARPPVIGHYINDIVYNRLAPGIKEELKTRNPTSRPGVRRLRHHQWLSQDIGHPRLAEHIYALLGMMRASKDWDGFKTLLDAAFPKKTIQKELAVH